MEAKELFKLASSIYGEFDPSNTGQNHVEDILFDLFDKEISSIGEALSKEGFETEESFEYLVHTAIPWGYFGLGYAVGQLFDLTDPGAQETIKTIQQEIREKGLLPYLPRERKG